MNDVDEKRTVIDLEKLTFMGNQAFSGRELGRELREKAQLDAKDHDSSLYSIRIPEGTGTFTPSFFSGMFGDSVVRLQRSDFERKYRFIGEPYRRLVDRGIAEALVRGPVGAY